jgi:site-specific DNA-methyltransferase (adenine-specific)
MASVEASPPEAVWHGAEDLRPLLIEVGDLHPHPRNPRRGAVDELRRSLERFGQQKPVLALPDGTLVAGHHVWRAADANGWTHVAVIRSDLTDHEVEAYLLADNRLSDLGLYDDASLAALLAEVGEAAAGLAGTGYDDGELAALLASLEPLEPPAEFPEVNPSSEYRCPSCGYEWSGLQAPGVHEHEPESGEAA